MAHQDTVGPMTRSISDAAIVLSVIAGKDPNDNYTLAQPNVVLDYTKALRKDALKGKRIGVPRHVYLDSSGLEPAVLVEFEKALDVLRDLGATVVDPADMPSAEELILSDAGYEDLVLKIDFKASHLGLDLDLKLTVNDCFLFFRLN
jgi:amidase